MVVTGTGVEGIVNPGVPGVAGVPGTDARMIVTPPGAEGLTNPNPGMPGVPGVPGVPGTKIGGPGTNVVTLRMPQEGARRSPIMVGAAKATVSPSKAAARSGVSSGSVGG